MRRGVPGTMVGMVGRLCWVYTPGGYGREAMLGIYTTRVYVGYTTLGYIPPYTHPGYTLLYTMPAVAVARSLVYARVAATRPWALTRD